MCVCHCSQSRFVFVCMLCVCGMNREETANLTRSKNSKSRIALEQANYTLIIETQTTN